MESIEFGKTKRQVSRIWLGGWQASGWASSNDDRFIRTLRYAIDSGVDAIDTAEAYGNGHSERLIGNVLGKDRDHIFLASKFSHTQSAPQDIRKSLEGSLKRLRTDYLDLYQQHWPPRTPALQETIDELLKLKQEGKIRAIGVSNWMEPEWGEIKDPKHIDSLQPCYSLLWRSIELAVLPLCQRHDISVVAYSPLCQGLLSGRFKTIQQTPNDHRKHNRLFNPQQFSAVQAFLVTMKEIADDYNRTVAQVALRWLLDKAGVSAVIVGASSPQQLDENLGALGWNLKHEDWERLSQLSRPFSSGLLPHDTLWNWHPRESTR